MSMKELARNLVLPPKQYDSYLLNKVGIQPARMLFQEILWRLRPTLPFKEQVFSKQLREEGCLCLPDFLSPDDFQALKKEFYAAYEGANPDIRNRVAGHNLIEEIDVFEKGQQKYEHTRNLLLRSRRLRQLISRTARTPMCLPPACILQRLSVTSYEGKSNVILHNNESFDTETILHQDSSLPIYKAWFYIEDVGKEEGAFVFAPGSHRVSYSRLKYEYKRSLHLLDMRDKRTDRVPRENLASDRYVPSQKDREHMGIREISLTGAANTLVIANTRGFHRRGDIKTGRVRHLIHLDYRRLQSRLNWLPFISRMSGIEEMIVRNRRPEKKL